MAVHLHEEDLSADVRFKDLGLLVIDEQHKFGVTQREKLLRNKLSNRSCLLWPLHF